MKATKVFFPSCKIKAAFPDSDAKLAAYLERRWGIAKAGCCRESLHALAGKEAVVICHTCASIIEESSNAGNLAYAWEYIDRDESFPFPDYKGEEITLQDCYMARDRSQVQNAVRSLLRKMNFKLVELEGNREKTEFCGLRTIPPLKANQELAPKHFCQDGSFTPLAESERKEVLEQYANKLTTKRVVNYCNACHNALKLGGAESVHLLELLFPKEL